MLASDLILNSLLIACHHDEDSNADSYQDPESPTVESQVAGDPDAEARAVLVDFSAPPVLTDAEIDLDAAGRRIVRTQVEILFQPDATVDEINTLLARYQATIVGSLENMSMLILQVPDSGDAAVYAELLENLREEPLITDVIKVTLPSIAKSISTISPRKKQRH